MADKKKQVDSPAPQLGEIAAELAFARSKAGLSHSELNRITGISRTVLIGYEAGRTKPGAKEIRLLCDALKVTPNRLIYGSEELNLGDKFGLLFDNLNSDDAQASIKLGQLMLMLSKEERSALLTLARSILVERHGKQVLETLSSIALSIYDVSDAMAGGEEWSIEELEEFKQIIEKKISERISASPKKRNKK